MVVAVPPGPERERFLPLLLLADDAGGHVRAHLDDGELFVALDGDEAVGAVQAVERDGATELTLVAVATERQGRGVGRRMVADVLDLLRDRGVGRVLVGTSNAGVENLRFYQLCGFRMLAVERDHFDEARGYDGTERHRGIVHRDLVWLDRLL